MRARSAGLSSRRRGATTMAVLTDLLLGEPPTAFHPTALMGRGISVARRQRDDHSTPSEEEHGAALVRGAALVSVGLGVSIAAAALAAMAVQGVGGRSDSSRRLRGAAEGAVLKPAISIRALLSAGKSVERALRRGDLRRARTLLSWHLVSRDTTQLTAHQVAGAAISSLAENLSDSVVAPLLAYRFGGLPAAYGYRFVNTADAMLGYRSEELEWFGKSAARLDDLLNLGPSRATALLIALSARLVGGEARRAVRIAWRDASRTPSPNGGWAMAAMAGALGVRLEKRGVYTLGAELREPEFDDIRRARMVIVAVTALITAMVEVL